MKVELGMTMSCTPLLPVVIVSDDPKLAATMSCYLAHEGTYLSVMDGPRMQRPDERAEVIRRNNGIARVDPQAVFLAGVESEGLAALKSKLPRRLQLVVPSISSLKAAELGRVIDNAPIVWGNDQIGVGLLKAMRAGTSIEFEDRPSPIEQVPTRSGHLVVCEAGEELSEVIAANYAFALGAGLAVIPAIPKEEAEAVMERFYSLYQSGHPQGEFLTIREKLQRICGDLDLTDVSSFSFFTRTRGWLSGSTIDTPLHLSRSRLGDHKRLCC